MYGTDGGRGLTYAGRVAHPSLHLVEHPTGGGRTGHVTLGVDSHGSDGAHLPPARQQRREITY